jgi:tetratricopeptide (TPR) repeat protein
MVSAAALVTGTSAALWQAAEARRERNAALQHETAARESEARAVAAAASAATSENLALKQKERAEQTAEFLSRLLDHAAAEVEGGRNPEALAGALGRSSDLLRKITQDAALQGDLLKRISRLYISIGDWRNAIATQRELLEVTVKLHGPESTEAFAVMLDYLKSEADHGMRAAVPEQIEALQLRIEKAGGKGGKLWFDVLREQVRVWIKLDDSHKALKVGERIMAAVTEWKVLGQLRMNARITHASALEFAGRFDEALKLLEVCRQTGVEEKAKEASMLSIERRQLLILEARGDHKGGAAVLLRRLEAMHVAAPLPGADQFVAILMQLAGFESAAGQHEEAGRHVAEALALTRRPESAGTSAAGGECRCLVRLAECETAAGQHEAAIRHAQEGRQCALRNGKKRDLIGALEQLAWSHHAAGQMEEAFAVWQETCEVHADDPNFKSVFYPLAEMAAIRHAQMRHAEAVKIVSEIWRRCLSHPLGAEDIGELGYTAQMALKYWAAQEKADSGTPPPAELAAWKKAAETDRAQKDRKGRATADKGTGTVERVRKAVP